MDIEKQFKKMFNHAFNKMAKRYGCDKEEVQIVLKANPEESFKNILIDVWVNYKVMEKDSEIMQVLNFMDSSLITTMGIDNKIADALVNIAETNNVEKDDIKVPVIIRNEEIIMIAYNGNKPLLNENGKVKILEFDEVVELV